jgi:pimeloyl-ACP methyl ester carboxylesterase
MAADERVESVKSIWAPRFVANGIDALDMQRILASIETWEDWAPAWSASADRYETLGREALAAGHRITAGQHLQRAALTVHFARIFADPGGTLHHRQVALFADAAPLLDPPSRRLDIDTDVARIPGYLRFPKGVEKPGLVLIMPGLDSVKEQLAAWEPYFLDRGLATLSIEGPGQGDTRYQLPYRDEDYQAAIIGVARFIRDLEGIDADRVVIVGVSLGGYLAVKTAGRTGKIIGLQGVVEFGGPYDLSMRRRRQVQFMVDAWIRLTGAADEEEAAGILEGCTLEGVLADLKVPVLVCHGGRDVLVPLDDAHRIVAELGPWATLYLEPEGNHNINSHHTISRPVVADWAADRINGRG